MNVFGGDNGRIVASQKYRYACVYCPECCDLMPFDPIGYGGPEFQPYDPGPLRCRKNHLRVYKAKDVRVVELDQPKRVVHSS